MSQNKRILLAKMGLDCHDTGIITVAQQLRDNGFEVVYLGLHNSAEQVVRAAIDEDVAVIGVSFLSGQHMAQMKKLFAAMESESVNLPVLCGGVIPAEDAEALRELGAVEIMTPGALSQDILEVFNRVVAAAHS